MAIKIEIQFEVFRAGRRIDSIRRATFVNDFKNGISRVEQEVQKAYPEIVDAQVEQNVRLDQVGMWLRLSQAKGTFYLLTAKKLQQ